MGKCQCSSHVGGENNRRGLVGSPSEVTMKRPWPALGDGQSGTSGSGSGSGRLSTPSSRTRLAGWNGMRSK